MSTSKMTQNIGNFLATEETYAPPSIVAKEAILKNWRDEYARSIKDPDAFWAGVASEFYWSKPWTKVSEFDGIHHQWFIGARTNITLNALDRHAKSDRFNHVAFIWLGEDGSERVVTYGQLYRMVCRFANGLKSINVRKGDRVIIYMPLTIEGIVSMLACARIGAIHSVVYAGLGHTALRDRIVDAGAKVVIAGELGYRRGKPVPLKSIVDEAVNDLDFVERVIVVPRTTRTLDNPSPREINYYDLEKFSSECPAEEMDAEDPLFILYTSGTTGKPKGVVHVHGGFMVGTTYHLCARSTMSGRAIFSGAHRTSGGSWATAISSTLRSAPEPPRCFAKAQSTIRPRRGLGDRGTIRRDQDVHRAHGDPHVDALRRKPAVRA